ncbi:hypothetical protein Tco_0999960 [Tanacetum coccineum]
MGGNTAEDQEIPVDTGVIRIDDIVPATVAEKPKVQKRMRKADGNSGSNHPPKKLKEDHGTFDDVGVTAVATVPFVTSSVTPTLEHSSHDSSTNAIDDEVTSIVRSFVPSPPLMTATTATKGVVETFSISVPRACHEPVHHTLFADPLLWVRPTKMLQLLVEFSFGVARQTCLSSEVRLRLEHEFRGREKFEAEAAKAIHLRGQIATVEAVEAAQASELDGLKERNAAIEGQLSCEELSIKIEVIQDEHVKFLSDKVARLDTDLMGMSLHLDKEGIGRAIDKGIHDALAASLDYGKVERGLAEVATYNPAAEANYVAALTISDALVPLIEPLSAENLVCQASTFGVPTAITTTSLSTTFIQTSSVPLIPVADDRVLGVEQPTKVPSPSRIVFEKEELETTPEHTTAS